ATIEHGTLYSLNSDFLVLAILIKTSASLRSCFRNAAKPSGEVGAATTTCLSRNATNFGSLNSFWNSLDSLATTSGGVPFGAPRPHQPWPGYPPQPTSPKVGTFGSSGERLAEVTASAFTLPASSNPMK